MFGTVLLFLLLSANLNAQPAEVDSSVEEREMSDRIQTLLELEAQSLYDRNTDVEDTLEIENQLSNLYNREEERGIRCTACKLVKCKIPLVCSGCCKDPDFDDGDDEFEE